MRKTTLVAVMVVLVAFAASAVLASVTFTPPPASNKQMNMAMIKLVPQKAAPKASGMASLIANKDKTKCKLAIEVKGLDPKKVYTILLTRPAKNGQQQSKVDVQGIGAPPYRLKIDSKGRGKVVSQDMDVKTMMTWKDIQIIEHKSGDPNDDKRIDYALLGDATKLR